MERREAGRALAVGRLTPAGEQLIRYGRRPWLRLRWKSAIAFLIFAWFSGLRASATSFVATPEIRSFRIMPATVNSLC